MSERLQLREDETVLYRFKARYRAGKGKIPEGTLYLTTHRVIFRGEDRASAPVCVISLGDVVSRQLNKPGNKNMIRLQTGRGETAQKYIFEFAGDDSLGDRDAFREAVEQLVPSLARQSLPPAASASSTSEAATTPAPHTADQLLLSEGEIKAVGGRFFPPLSGPLRPSESIGADELGRRVALLANNTELRELHELLVRTGVVAEEDFWASRKAMLREEAAKEEGRRMGMPSELLADVRAVSDSANKMRFTLNTHIIDQIFTEFPAVRRAYIENVPDKMKEEEFWTRYFSSAYFHRDRGRSTTTNLENDLFAKYSEEQEREEQRNAQGKRARRITADPLFDLTGEEFGSTATGKGTQVSHPSNQTTAASPLVRRFNRHGALVLEAGKRPASGLPGTRPSPSLEGDGVSSKAKRRAITRLDDLDRGPSTLDTYVPLQIQDQSRYFEGHGSEPRPNNLEGKGMEHPARIVLEELSRLTPDVSRALISSSEATETLYKITESAAQSLRGRGAKAEGDFDIDREFRKDLQTAFLTTMELLRHFWSCYPLTTALVAQKLSRVVSSMESLYDNLMKMKEAIPTEKRAQYVQILKPIVDALDQAFVYHENQKKEREGRRAATGQ